MDQGKLWDIPPDKSRLELKPVGGTEFYVPEIKADIEFIAKPNDGMTVKVTQPGGVTVGDRTAPQAPLTPDDLSHYAGVYWSEELETQYTIRVRDGSLVAINSHHREFALSPSAKDRFESNKFFFTDVQFIRDDKGKVTALTVGGGRVTAIRFERK